MAWLVLILGFSPRVPCRLAVLGGAPPLPRFGPRRASGALRRSQGLASAPLRPPQGLRASRSARRPFARRASLGPSVGVAWRQVFVCVFWWSRSGGGGPPGGVPWLLLFSVRGVCRSVGSVLVLASCRRLGRRARRRCGVPRSGPVRLPWLLAGLRGRWAWRLLCAGLVAGGWWRCGRLAARRARRRCSVASWLARRRLLWRSLRVSFSSRLFGGCAVAPVVGFCGSRSLVGPAWSSVVGGLLSAVPAGASVVVGCARGADALVRAACPSASVFAVASGRWGSGRSAFARRSAALVAAVAAGGPGSFLFGLVAGPCPAGLVPSSSPSRCFGGFGSGSWSSLALAVGLGVPVVVVWCGPGAPSLPASWGSWSLAPWPGRPWSPGLGWSVAPAAPAAVAARLPGF